MLRKQRQMKLNELFDAVANQRKYIHLKELAHNENITLKMMAEDLIEKTISLRKCCNNSEKII